jgi:hypothetical protein
MMGGTARPASSPGLTILGCVYICGKTGSRVKGLFSEAVRPVNPQEAENPPPSGDRPATPPFRRERKEARPDAPDPRPDVRTRSLWQKINKIVDMTHTVIQMYTQVPIAVPLNSPRRAGICQGKMKRAAQSYLRKSSVTLSFRVGNVGVVSVSF